MLMLLIAPTVAHVESNNNILCSNYDEMLVYSGTWSLNKIDNDTCTLQQTGTVDYKIWYGTADGGTYDEDYNLNEFVVEAAVAVNSGTHNGGTIFRASDVLSSHYYYGIWPSQTAIRVWSCSSELFPNIKF